MPGAGGASSWEWADHRAGLRRLLGAKRIRVGLVYPVTGIAGNDMKFVHAARLGLRHAHRPDAGVAALHRVGARVPAVPVADHGDRLRVGRPDGEVSRVAEEMRAELLVQPAVGPFAEKILVVPRQGDRLLSDGRHWH